MTDAKELAEQIALLEICDKTIEVYNRAYNHPEKQSEYILATSCKALLAEVERLREAAIGSIPKCQCGGLYCTNRASFANRFDEHDWVCRHCYEEHCDPNEYIEDSGLAKLIEALAAQEGE